MMMRKIWHRLRNRAEFDMRVGKSVGKRGRAAFTPVKSRYPMPESKATLQSSLHMTSNKVHPTPIG